jgi:hypothetical protein
MNLPPILSKPMKPYGLNIVQRDAKSAIHVPDPDGLGVQFGGTRQ